MFGNLTSRLQTKVGRQSLRHSIAKRFLNPVLRRWGYTIVAEYFYQPLPSLQEISLYQDRPRPLESLNLDLEKQSTFVNALLVKYGEECRIGGPITACGYREERSGLVSGDAETLYCMVRDAKPATVIEVGAGGSTQIIGAAMKRNATESGRRSRLISIDPFPPHYLENAQADVGDLVEFELLRQPVQEIAVDTFAALEASDLLFVDSSHVFKQGSDVEFEFLKVYPRLNQGVIVHIHDIFLPFDYPAEWNIKDCWYWNEQYFLETFLQCNSKYEILASLSLVANARRGVFARHIQGFSSDARPASFWMRAMA